MGLCQCYNFPHEESTLNFELEKLKSDFDKIFKVNNAFFNYTLKIQDKIEAQFISSNMNLIDFIHKSEYFEAINSSTNIYHDSKKNSKNTDQSNSNYNSIERNNEVNVNSTYNNFNNPNNTNIPNNQNNTTNNPNQNTDLLRKQIITCYTHSKEDLHSIFDNEKLSEIWFLNLTMFILSYTENTIYKKEQLGNLIVSKFFVKEKKDFPNFILTTKYLIRVCVRIVLNMLLIHLVFNKEEANEKLANLYIYNNTISGCSKDESEVLFFRRLKMFYSDCIKLTFTYEKYNDKIANFALSKFLFEKNTFNIDQESKSSIVDNLIQIFSARKLFELMIID